jgi:hypothetical protein
MRRDGRPAFKVKILGNPTKNAVGQILLGWILLEKLSPGLRGSSLSSDWQQPRVAAGNWGA